MKHKVKCEGVALNCDLRVKKVDSETVNHRIKRFLFKYYAVLSVCAIVAALVPFAFVPSTQYWKIFASVLAGIWGFAFGVQKQQIEEMRLFKELFDSFNRRYNEQNEKLNFIYRQPPDSPLQPDEVEALFDYFNLCGEEYFYFDKGFIYPEVWQVWKSGMKVFRQNPRIKKLWDEELKTYPYYGLSFEEEGSSEKSYKG